MPDQSRYYEGSIDSHAHVASLASKGLDPKTVLGEARDGGMGAILEIGIEPADVRDRIARFAAFDLLAFTAGLHPTSVRPDDCEHQLELLEDALGPERDGAARTPRVVAVGEIGLDFYWSNEHRDLQIEVLERQIGLARAKSLPVIIHNRSSEREVLEVLERTGPSGVMHCFSQDAAYCRSCLDLGMHVSFGGNLTYRGSEEVREAAAMVPDERLLVETDSPYLSPQAVRGRPNHPGHLGFIIDELARLRDTTPERIAALTAANARRLFALTLSSGA